MEMKIIFSVLLAAGLLTAVAPNIVLASTTTDENGFNMGYNNGLSQGGIDRQAKVFHIGTKCIGQTVAWCNGYLSGYLDGFFATLPLSTHSSTTIIVRGGGGSEGDKGRGCHDSKNMTIPCPTPPEKTQKCPDGSVIPISDKCPKAPTPPQQPNPGCNAVVGGSPCGSSSTPSSPSTPSTPSTPSGSQSSGSSSSGSSSSGSSSSGSSSGSPSSQPTKLS